MSDSVEIFYSDDKKRRVRLLVDCDAQNLRTEYDQIVSVVTVPGSTYLDVESPGDELSDWWARLNRRYAGDVAVRIFARYVAQRGGISYLHTPERGPVSLWYIFPETVQIEGLTDPAAYIASSVEEYQSWADGDVYEYIVERPVHWTSDEGDERDTWEFNGDSCCGLIGFEYAVGVARDAMAYCAQPVKT
ncbi:hypothetical protein [Streptomyces sp. H27-C3]|uniref:hypothetical protein n=1 Tax=Streptomyces sp. H27-C3 TaxID=3046305 RepID=UPI0024BAF7BA|nr:hypothetical protein [Streptomyces sp. H27-C3]MDJ0463090.1 hypothetical protein [Streptomyces sp. H27-C3]